MIRRLLLAVLALLLGLGTAECLTRCFSFRRWIAELAGRGELQALVGRRGIYDTDVTRAWRAELFAVGADPQQIVKTTADEQKRAALERLRDRERVNAAATGQPVEAAAIERDLQLLRWQFRDDKSWQASLRVTGAAPWILRRLVAENLRARKWIESQVALRLAPNEKDCRHYFENFRAQFQLPPRMRASHLFLAAPDGYPPEVIAAKRSLSELLARRIANGESFPALIAEFSEDEATRRRAGDLSYFAAERMLPEIFNAAAKLRPGEISAPIRSRLGFHILRLTEALPARALTFEEVQPEISMILENEQRVAAISALLK